jgi:acetamidase/formamidase
MAVHSLEPTDRTLHGYFSPDRKPVLTVDPGDTVRYRTLDSGWSVGQYSGGDFPNRPRVPQHRSGFGHALIGPVAVRGARPGDTLAIRIDAVVPGGWGYTVGGGWPSPFNKHYGVEADGVVHTWTLDAAAGVGRNQHGHEVALRPFMGVLGMPPAEPGEHSTIPPRPHGGNLDCKELVAGSTLYLPVPVAEALFSVGDGHARQGDGEVSGTAIECPMDRVELTFDVRTDLPIAAPLAETPAGLVTMGLGDTVDEATYRALNCMFDELQRRLGLTRPDAVALASVVVDVRVTQVVNQVVGAHAVLPTGALLSRGG